MPDYTHLGLDQYLTSLSIPPSSLYHQHDGIDNLRIHGDWIEEGTLKVNALSVGSQFWAHDIAWTATDEDTASWGAGTLTFANGDNYAISAGNTGNIGAKTYVYFDKNASTTVLQTSTTYSDAVGDNKALLAIVLAGAAGERCLIAPVFSDGTTLAGPSITTGYIAAERLDVTVAYITASAQIASAVIGDAHITGTLTVSHTDAKCTDPNADQTSANPQSVSWLTDAGAMAYEDLVEKAKLGTTIITGGYLRTDLLSTAYAYITNTAQIANAIIADAHITGTLTVGKTDAKCTDPNADQTSAHTAANAATYTGAVIDKAYIGNLNAEKITSGTLTLTSGGVNLNVETGALTLNAGADISFTPHASDPSFLVWPGTPAIGMAHFLGTPPYTYLYPSSSGTAGLRLGGIDFEWGDFTVYQRSYSGGSIALLSKTGSASGKVHIRAGSDPVGGTSYGGIYLDDDEVTLAIDDATILQATASQVTVNKSLVSSVSHPLVIGTTGFAYFPSNTDHVAYYKKTGTYSFYWRKSDSGYPGGGNETTLMELSNVGALNTPGTITSGGNIVSSGNITAGGHLVGNPLYMGSGNDYINYRDSDNKFFFYADGSLDVSNLVANALHIYYGGITATIHKPSGDPNDLWFNCGQDFYFQINSVGKAIIDADFWTAGSITKGGACQFDIPHPDGSNRRLAYTGVESPKVILKDVGRGKLKKGTALIKLPEHWGLVTEEDDTVAVLVTPHAECLGLYVPEESISHTQFEVKELGGGTSNASFSWEMTCIRKGYSGYSPERELTDDDKRRKEKLEKSASKKLELEKEGIVLRK